MLKELRISGNVFPPKLSHYSLHLVEAVAMSVGKHIAELTEVNSPRMRITGMWCECGISRLMNDALGGDVELIASDECVGRRLLR